MTSLCRAVAAAASALGAAGCTSVPLIHPFVEAAPPFFPGEQGLGVNVVMLQTPDGIEPFTTMNYRYGMSERVELSFLAYSLGGRTAVKYLARESPQGPSVAFSLGTGPFWSNDTRRAKAGYTVDATIVVSKDYGFAQYYGGYRQAAFVGPALGGQTASHGVVAFGYQQKVYDHLNLLGELALLLDMSPSGAGGVFPIYSVSFVMPWGGPRVKRRRGPDERRPSAPLEIGHVDAKALSEHVVVELRLHDEEFQYFLESVTISPLGGQGVARRADLLCRGPGRYAAVVRTPEPIAPGSYRLTLVYVKGVFRSLDARRLPTWLEPPDRRTLDFPFEVR